LNGVATSSTGIELTWELSKSDECHFGGEGGSALTYYQIEWDVVGDFSTAALHSILVADDALGHHLGGRDVILGVVSTDIDEGQSYYI
jgi:hypothetical protein